MPNKIKSGKQFRFLEAASKLKGMGPSPEVAKEMLSKESFASKSKFAKKVK